MAGWLWFDVLLFALLMIPSLFYSEGYRTCLRVVYGLSYWVFFGMAIYWTAWGMWVVDDLGKELVEGLADAKVDISMGPPGRYAGMKAGTKALFQMYIRD
jgi:hypothetical protein